MPLRFTAIKFERLLPAALAAAVLVLPGRAAIAGTAAENAMAICGQMEGVIGRIVPTKCLPAPGQTGTNFVLVSEKPVFGDAVMKKMWLLAVAAAYGEISEKQNPPESAGQQSAGKQDTLYLADAESMKQGRFELLPGAVAKELEKRAQANEITADAMYDGIVEALRPHQGQPQ